ncbi:polyketide synthase dehydratase domain-containing protein [Streptomyces actinomycinicus]|uniref:Polyketide synthase dehydratase domain-containing protein n=2 Tax=Streptomyces actinomycinicus TaxID=1695166 RepID=A0A937EIN9_9ACTN|nr:polyketide synthase dehydratase domain-containing protein [Streptomyces actinomycinicus]
MGVVPDAVAGHSVGEWTAMAAAGLYSAGQVDAFMAEFDPDTVTVPGLAFAAVGASAAHVRAALADGDRADRGIVLSHDNAPRQSMVCGPAGAVEDFVRALRAQGVLCQVLPFRSGFHTPMLEPFLAPIKEAADRFRLHPPTVPVWSGTTAAPFPRDEPAVRELFVRHLLEPVRFRELTEALYAAGHRVFVQTGPGRLTSLIGDTLGDRDHLAVAANSPHHSGLSQLRRTATALWTAGAPVTPSLPPRTTAAPSVAPRTAAAQSAAPRTAAAQSVAPRTAAAQSVVLGDTAAPSVAPRATAIPPAPPRGAAAPSAPAQAAASAPAGGRPPVRPVRLDLGSALVSLDGPTLDALRAELRPRATPPQPAHSTGPASAGSPERVGGSTSVGSDDSASAGSPADSRGRGALSGPASSGRTASAGNSVGSGSPEHPVGPTLDDLAPHHPAAAELTALLRDTAHTAAQLITASRRPADGTTPAPAAATPTPPPSPTPPSRSRPLTPPAPLTPLSRSRPLTPPASLTPLSRSRPLTPPAPLTPPSRSRPLTPPAPLTPPSPSTPLTPAAAPAAPLTTTSLHISAHTMPHLLDHCFFPQRPGWPDLDDRWPVVPATTIVRHMMDAAEAAAAPGLHAVAVHGARFDRWLTATPPVDVPVTVTPVPGRPQHLGVTFGPTARAVIELAPHAPAPPPLRPLGDAPERRPEHTAAQLYRERWMFHGPRFQGLTELTGIGERHIRGVITTPAAPGALLDNVGQLLGYWIMATRTERTVVFPVQLREVRFHGPHPAPGARVGCLLRITSLTDTVLEADAELTVGGRVWARITGWQDRRFDNDPSTRPVERFPERHTLSTAMPGGWALVHERWPDLASRELIMRNSLGRTERAAYAERPPRGRRQWLLGRIAVKDAVRHWLWQHGEGPVFPAEIRVGNDELGRPGVAGVHGRTLPPLDVSLAHRAEAGVAIVRPHRPRPGPGIDIEEVTDRDPATLTTALGPAELRLLRALCDDAGEPEAVWFTRFWAAKEAVAKAEGVGFGGRPRDFTVLEAAPDGSRLLVSGRLERSYRVHCTPVSSPPALPRRAYVAAWTAGPGADDGPHESASGPALAAAAGQAADRALDQAADPSAEPAADRALDHTADPAVEQTADRAVEPAADRAVEPAVDRAVGRVPGHAADAAAEEYAP